MATCVLFTPRREEGKLLLQRLHERAAYLTEQSLECLVFQELREAVDHIRAHRTEAIAWDVSQTDALTSLPKVRLCSQDAFLLILASSDISPLTFLRPEIAPSSLILRPLSSPEVDRVVCEMLRSIFSDSSGDCFLIERRGEQQRIPWEQIYYFESRGKKLYTRLRGEEIGFYGTLEALAGSIPENFLRCHRSFIVNTEKIDKVRFAENLILLWDGLMVPLSRGYKRDIKERGSGHV